MFAHLACRSRADRENFKGMVKESRGSANGVPDDLREPVDEEEARGALFQSKAQAQGLKQAKHNKNAAYGIGKDLDGIPPPPPHPTTHTWERIRLQQEFSAKSNAQILKDRPNKNTEFCSRE